MLHKKAPLVSSFEVLEARIAPATIYAVDTTDHLIHFDSATPGTLPAANVVAMTGLGVGEHVQGIDFRPSTGELYALGITVGANGTGRIYTVNLNTAALTPVGAAFSTTLNANNDYAFDFNPTSDKIRVVGDTGLENLRIDPDSGAIFSTDTNVTSNTQIDGVAYSNNFEGATKTTLYGINKQSAHVVTIGGIDGNPSPNTGAVTPLSSGLGFTPANFKIGFDIESRTGTGYVVMTVGAVTGLYTVDLTTGAATFKGAIGAGTSLLPGMSVAPPSDLKIMSATTASYIDQDGDNVTVKITGAAVGASLTPSDFHFSTGPFGSQLKLLDLSAASHAATPQEWAHASITISAVPVKTGTVTRGDSFANVGYINATGVDLGAVAVDGDLGQIDAGDATTTTQGLASLTAVSMGVVINSQRPNGGVPDQKSDIVGKLGSLTVKGDFTRELISVTGGATPADGSIGNITIAGDIVGIGLFASSGITSTGAMGNILLKGDLFGGAGTGVGSILAGGSVGTVTVYGSIYGGSTTNAGIIQSNSNMGNVVIKGSIYGGTDDHTGEVHASGTLGNVMIGGSIVGGTLVTNGDLDSGIVFSTGSKMGNVTVGGSLMGSNGGFSGSLFSSGTIGTITIGGSVKGGSVGDSASIEAGGNIGTVKIGGDLVGGTGNFSGSIETFGVGSIGAVTVLGNVTGSGTTINGIISTNQLAAVKILGSLEALSPGGVRISARGDTAATKTAASAAAIASLSITGSARNALILGGDSAGGSATNPDATIGPVTVGQNWIATQLIAGVTNLGADDAAGGAGVNADNVNYGDAHDKKITSNDVSDTTGLKLISKIASVTIKGYAMGTPSGFSATDGFGIVAQQVGLVKVGLRSYTLATGTDSVGLPLGVDGDFLVHEVPIV